MQRLSQRRALKLIASVGLTGGLVAGAVAVIAQGQGVTAAPVSATLTYNCAFPLIGAQPLSVQINSNMPTSIAAGTPTGAFQISAAATVSDLARTGLRTVGGATLEGTVKASASLTAPNINLPLTVDMSIPQVPIPATTGTFVANANGSTPSLTFTAANAGTATVSVGNLVMTLTPKAADGSPTGLGTFDSACTLDPGQSGVLHTFQITGGTTTTAPPTTGPATTAPPTTGPATTAPPTTAPPTTRPPTTAPPTTRPPTTTGPPAPIHLNYGLTGQTNIVAANGSVPLTGGISADFNLASGTYNANLTLQPAVGSFTIMGFLPTTANVEFIPTSTTGTLVDGRLTAKATLDVKLTSVNLLGFLPIGGGPDCKTSTPAVIDLASPAGQIFDPTKGGTLEGTYTLPALNTANSACGWLGDIVSVFMAGPNNTISLNLAAAAK